jgi:hypothetical protein
LVLGIEIECSLISQQFGVYARANFYEPLGHRVPFLPEYGSFQRLLEVTLEAQLADLAVGGAARFHGRRPRRQMRGAQGVSDDVQDWVSGEDEHSNSYLFALL